MNVTKPFLGLIATMALAGGFGGEANAYGGEYCREYTRTVYIGNKRQESYGTACLRPNGDWEIQDERNASGAYYYAPQPAVQNVTYIVNDRGNRRPVQYNRVVFRKDFGHDRVNWYHNGKRQGHGGGWDRHDRRDRHDHRDRHDNGRRGHGRN